MILPMLAVLVMVDLYVLLVAVLPLGALLALIGFYVGAITVLLIQRRAAANSREAGNG